MSKLILRLERLADGRGAEASDDDAAPGPARLRSVVDLTAARADDPLDAWSVAVVAAVDGCLVLDVDGAVVAISAAAAGLLGCRDDPTGRRLLDLVELVDFDAGGPAPEYAGRIPPLSALRGTGLSRSLLRVRHPDGSVVTIDACAAPVRDVGRRVVGSITFLAPIAVPTDSGPERS